MMKMTWRTVLHTAVVMATVSVCFCLTSQQHTTPPQRSSGSTACRADIIFVLGMFENVNFERIKSLVSRYVNTLDISDANSRVGLVTYSTTVKTAIHLNSYSSVASLQKNISLLTYSGSKYVNTSGALAYVRTTMLSPSTGARYNVRKVVVLITAGESTDITSTQIEADKLKSDVVGRSTTKVVSVGIGRRVSLVELSIVASQPLYLNVVRIVRSGNSSDVKQRLTDAICTAPVSSTCTQYDVDLVKRRWNYLRSSTPARRQLYFSHVVLVLIARYDKSVSLKLFNEYMKEDERISLWAGIIESYPDMEKLKARIQYDAAARTELARAFYGHINIIAISTLRVFSQIALLQDELRSWDSCLIAMSESVKLIADNVMISAVCHVDKQSGLPQYPISGNIVFTQPLFGGDTEISASLCGFNDTKRRGWHVHAVGSTDYRCLAAGSYFNPQQQHGAPDDRQRHVGDLGNFQADNKGKVIVKVNSRQLSLQGVNDVIGRTVVVNTRKRRRPGTWQIS